MSDKLRCTQVAKDGLRMDPGDICRCLCYRKCVDTGCHWRKWHMMKPTEFLPKKPPTNTDLI